MKRRSFLKTLLAIPFVGVAVAKKPKSCWKHVDEYKGLPVKEIEFGTATGRVMRFRRYSPLPPQTTPMCEGMAQSHSKDTLQG